jgi:hypothetical protein
MNQVPALQKLREAFHEACECGLLDDVQGLCLRPDSINDVIDALCVYGAQRAEEAAAQCEAPHWRAA